MIQAVTFWSLSWRSLNFSKRSLITIPKRSQRIARQLFFSLGTFEIARNDEHNLALEAWMSYVFLPWSHIFHKAREEVSGASTKKYGPGKTQHHVSKLPKSSKPQEVFVGPSTHKVWPWRLPKSKTNVTTKTRPQTHSPGEVVKKLQELLHDLFFVIVFFSSLSFYRELWLQ